MEARPTENRLGFSSGRYRAAEALAPELEAAVDGVVAAFADARLSDGFDGCPHCFTDADLAYVRDTPPLAMTNDDIGKITFKLVSTLGSERDIAHFVPAMIRALFEAVPLEDSLVLKNLEKIPADQWTGQRRLALRHAFETWYATRPSWYHDFGEADAIIEWTRAMLGRAPQAEPSPRPLPGWDADAAVAAVDARSRKEY